MAASQSVLDRRRALAWHPPEDLLAAAQANTWRGDPQPTLSAQRPVGPGVVWLGRKMRSMYPALITQTYARGRTLRPGQRGSMHHAGRAIDLMVSEVRGGPNRAGDAIANWLLANARAIGLQYMIWSGTQWSSATGRTSVYPGAEDHFNHLHLDLSNAGSAGSLPWYADMPADLRAQGTRAAPEANTDAADNEASPPIDLVITPEEAGIVTPSNGKKLLVAGLVLLGAGLAWKASGG